ncbi:hypothetical protein MNB_SV-12-860 [hydrothermal vent metagenome]|uniref:Co-chaperone DjlA N-terminal domain-containing protein n=1 Tax=hydrothermal vent metagenome TaxID=652676 RepID=A0A1W1CJE4_9ZZZZ
MAEWRKVAKVVTLGDGHVSQKEVEILREVILKDGNISKSEITFLEEIKAEAKTSVKLLDELIEDCKKLIK